MVIALTKEKITQDQLQEELQSGKTVQEIAHKYGYGHPSRSLNDKLRELGYSKTREIPKPQGREGTENKYYQLSISQEQLQSIKSDAEERYFKTVEDDQLVIRTTDREWEKQ